MESLCILVPKMDKKRVQMIERSQGADPNP